MTPPPTPQPGAGPATRRWSPRAALVGGAAPLSRFLPQPRRRTVGPFCLFDHYGGVVPAEMAVGPHPHIGIATVSWLFSGSLIHFDTLGNVAPLEAGGVNVMTAGRGIAHAERATTDGASLHGVQLWLALDEESRHRDADFTHRAHLPISHHGDLTLTAFVGTPPGEPANDRWSGRALAAQLDLAGNGSCPLDPVFEHALFRIAGTATLEGAPLAADEGLYLPPGRGDLDLAGDGGTRLLLLGGLPFVEELVMWWNFVARTDEEIRAAAAAWSAEARAGLLEQSGLAPITPPSLPTARLVARPSGGGGA